MDTLGSGESGDFDSSSNISWRISPKFNADKSEGKRKGCLAAIAQELAYSLERRIFNEPLSLSRILCSKCIFDVFISDCHKFLRAVQVSKALPSSFENGCDRLKEATSVMPWSSHRAVFRLNGRLFFMQRLGLCCITIRRIQI